eukprot:GHVU01174335.1.p1 GENE.GHVU01174335.1~~GHVU01174335.1.p1  ORF type:complete len:136 (+),score=20.98 GHVU01174335.1:370-777(+)
MRCSGRVRTLGGGFRLNPRCIHLFEPKQQQPPQQHRIRSVAATTAATGIAVMVTAAETAVSVVPRLCCNGNWRKGESWGGGGGRERNTHSLKGRDGSGVRAVQLTQSGTVHHDPVPAAAGDRADAEHVCEDIPEE